MKSPKWLEDLLRSVCAACINDVKGRDRAESAARSIAVTSTATGAAAETGVSRLSFCSSSSRLRPRSWNSRNGSRSNSSPNRQYTAATCLHRFDQ